MLKIGIKYLSLIKQINPIVIEYSLFNHLGHLLVVTLLVYLELLLRKAIS